MVMISSSNRLMYNSPGRTLARVFSVRGNVVRSICSNPKITPTEEAAGGAHVPAPSALWPCSNTRTSRPASTIADLMAIDTPCRSSRAAKTGIAVLSR